MDNKYNKLDPKEKRRSPRVEVGIAAMVEGFPSPQEIVNFSLHGVCLKMQSPSSLKPGQETCLTITIPHDKIVVRLKVRVAHVSHKGVGLEYLNLHPADVRTLEYCFNIFRSTIPMPRVP